MQRLVTPFEMRPMRAATRLNIRAFRLAAARSACRLHMQGHDHYRVPVLVSERARSPDEYPCGPCVRPEWSLHTSRRSPQGRRGLIERWPRPFGSTPAPVPAPPQSRRSSLDCTDQ